MRKKHHHKKKASPTKKWSAKLHLWFGLSVGIIVFIVSLSGTLYVFKDEVQNSLRKEVIYVKNEVRKKPFPINLLREKVSLELNEKYPISSVEIPLDKTKSYRFFIMKKAKGLELFSGGSDQQAGLCQSVYRRNSGCLQ
jgi:uncharacterized iron-regulated membrane protein